MVTEYCTAWNHQGPQGYQNPTKLLLWANMFVLACTETWLLRRHHSSKQELIFSLLLFSEEEWQFGLVDVVVLNIMLSSLQNTNAFYLCLAERGIPVESPAYYHGWANIIFVYHHGCYAVSDGCCRIPPRRKCVKMCTVFAHMTVLW